MRTRTVTWTGEVTESWSSTFCPSGAKPRAMEMARAASSALATWPVISRPLGWGVTRMRVPGSTRPIAASASVEAKAAGRTKMSYSATATPWASTAATVVRPAPTPKTNSVVALAGRTSAILGSATKTLAAAAGRVITPPVPAS